MAIKQSVLEVGKLIEIIGVGFHGAIVIGIFKLGLCGEEIDRVAGKIIQFVAGDGFQESKVFVGLPEIVNVDLFQGGEGQVGLYRSRVI